MNKSYSRLGNLVLEVILLLIGLTLFNISLLLVVPVVFTNEWIVGNVYYSYWLGNSIYGILLASKIKQNRSVAISIGFLSVMHPVFGGVFYLLSVQLDKNAYEG